MKQMKILLSNDDGVDAPGLQILASALSQTAEVVVVAPDGERSAIGTAVTLRRPLRLVKHAPLVPGVTTWAVNGTPGDSVIIGAGKVAPDADMVISGINSGHNLGDDVLISGTVGAALQGYLRGYPAFAVSVAQTETFPRAAQVARALAQLIHADKLPRDIFLNVNVPDLPADLIRAAKITRLASETHVDTVTEAVEGNETVYKLIRGRARDGHHPGSDIWAIEAGHVSVTPLHRELLRRDTGEIRDADLAFLTADLTS
jgi:5'-nucleotidase